MAKMIGYEAKLFIGPEKEDPKNKRTRDEMYAKLSNMGLALPIEEYYGRGIKLEIMKKEPDYKLNLSDYQKQNVYDNLFRLSTKAKKIIAQICSTKMGHNWDNKNFRCRNCFFPKKYFDEKIWLYVDSRFENIFSELFDKMFPVENNPGSFVEIELLELEKSLNIQKEKQKDMMPKERKHRKIIFIKKEKK